MNPTPEEALQNLFNLAAKSPLPKGMDVNEGANYYNKIVKIKTILESVIKKPEEEVKKPKK